MRLSAIPQIYRHLTRYREILTILSRYGIANWIGRLDLDFAKELFRDAEGEGLARQSPEARVRNALVELGPTFIKLGQILSTRPDLIGLELARELELLQADVLPDPPDVVRKTVEAELGGKLEELFDQFELVPLASASIGQVHRARLLTGEPVVVKVQHAGIETKIHTDMDILMALAQWSERFPDLANYRPRATMAEFQRQLRRELDFRREERHMREFGRYFLADSHVRIPQAHPQLSTSRVLTMELLEGVLLNDRTGLHAQGFDLAEVARHGAELYLRMIFTHGFYHADPHPGNLVLLPGGVIGLLDFGMVGRIDEQLREEIEELVTTVSHQDAARLAALITRVAAVPADLDRAALTNDVADFLCHYTTQRVDELDLSRALHEVIEMIRRYRMMLPERISMLIKVLVMLEGTSRMLEPSFSLIEVMRPYERQLVWQRLSPRRRVRKLSRFWHDLELLMATLPRGVHEIVQQVQSGKFDVHLDHRGLEPSVNRLVFGMLTSALFLGSSLMLSNRVPPLVGLPWVGDFSLLGALGCGVSIGLGLRLLRAINKSGHLDRRP